MTLAPKFAWLTRRPVGRARMALLSTMILAACGQSERERRVYAWMSCDECIDDQRPRVAALGDRAVADLAVNLLAPPPRRLENARRRIIESYRPVTTLTEQEYVAFMLEAYVARTQIRAAVSLGDIGTPAARLELERARAEAETRNYRPDVVRAISVSLARASHPRFTGTVRPASVNFGDTVRVIGDASLPWDGSETVELLGSPFGTEVLLNHFVTPGADDSLTFVAVGPIGSYGVEIGGLGPNAVTEVDTTLRIQSLRYETRTAQTARELTEADLPQTRYLVLGLHDNADTTDFIKVSPSVSLSVTATAMWPGLAEVHLVWRLCGGGGPGGSTVGGTVLSSGAGLGGAQISVAGSGLSTVTSPTGEFSLFGITGAFSPGGLVTIQFRRLGYHPRTFVAPVGTARNVFTVAPSANTAATAMPTASSTVGIAGGSCMLLQIWTPAGAGHQIVQLKLGQ